MIASSIGIFVNNDSPSCKNGVEDNMLGNFCVSW